MEFAVLGPLTVRVAGEPLTVTRAQGRLLAVLLCQPNQWIRADALADALWGAEGTSQARLQVLVSRLRKSLGDADRIQHDHSSYRVTVAPGELDVDRFLGLRRAGAAALNADDPDEAVRRLREAVDVWRGDPFTGIDDPPQVAAESARLSSERLAVLEDLYDGEIRRGSAADILAELSELAGAHPLRERLSALLMLGLHQCGRRAEALAAYQRARAQLIEELGLEPGEELRRAQATILAAADEIEVGTAGPDPVRPQQLPPDPADVVGRAAELNELTDLVDKHDAASSPLVVAIDGPAGIGKTTFAVHAAHRVRERYGDGQLFVDLRGYSSGEPVESSAALRMLLRALGVPPDGIPEGLDERSAMLRSCLTGHRMLIVLDNVRGAEQVRPLLPAAGCLLLVTSRNQLRGLAVHDGACRITLRPLTAEAAGGVLTGAVGSRRSADDPAAVAELAELCGRVPLALRIAGERASRFPGHGLAELAAELSDEHHRLDRLAGADDPAADLRAAFSWSYRTLAADDARTFRLLGLHPSGTLGLPAAAILTDRPASQVRRSLDRLVAHHLLEEPQPGRFKLHDLLRLYAAELATAEESAPDLHATTRRMLDWYLRTVAVSGRLVRSRGSAQDVVDAPDPATAPLRVAGPAQALDWFETERETLLDLVRRAYDLGFDAHTWQLAWSLLPFYATRQHLDDWRTTAMIGRQAAERLDDDRAVLFAANTEAIMHLESLRFEESAEGFRTALEMARRLGDRAREATSLSNLGLVFANQGDHGRAVEFHEQALVAEAAAPSSERAVSTTALNLSASQGALGNYHEAIRYGEAAAAQFRERGNATMEALALSNVAEGYLSLGDFGQARHYCGQALDLFASIDSKQGKPNTLIVLGRAHLAAGAVDEAAKAWEEARDLLLAASNPRAAEVEQLLHDLDTH
ncbi:AfsR/SARP family transcriptional regulator [Kribbella sp. CA-247076]|uniref:AfsR/SARP family transcriptional regulator n=1 Tax=Kribbella sp. CA-247076 TaxID=3239941 RepID=UPI003D8C4643